MKVKIVEGKTFPKVPDGTYVLSETRTLAANDRWKTIVRRLSEYTGYTFIEQEEILKEIFTGDKNIKTSEMTEEELNQLIQQVIAWSITDLDYNLN